MADEIKQPLDGKPKEEEIKNPENIDYKAELEKERQLREQEADARKKAEAALAKKRFKKSHDGEDPEDDAPPQLTREEIAETVREVVREIVPGVVSRTVNRTAIETSARAIASSPEEAELILEHYDHTINPTGDLEKDLRRARLIANEARVSKENEELRRKVNSDETKSRNAGGPGTKPEVKPEEDARDQDPNASKLMRHAGKKTVWDPVRKQHHPEGWVYDETAKAYRPPRNPQ